MSALIGAIAGHMLLGYPFTLLSMIGGVALTGVVVNDSIVLVDRVNELRRSGMPLRRAVIEGATSRLRAIQLTTSTTAAGMAPLIGSVRARDYLYVAAVVPGLIVGAAQIASVEVTQILGIPVAAIAMVGVFTGLAIWAASPVVAMTNSADAPLTRMAEETAFISVWVIIAYLAYDYAAAYAGLDLKAMFQAIAPVLPLIAAAIGFIPGCGPQVLVATLYVNGAIPFSALVANAISNDGDALFPAIALAPRAAIMATVYSTVPALLVAYALYFFAPGLLN